MSRAAPHDAPPMPNWPALMTTELACAYTSLARASFLLLAGPRPSRFSARMPRPTPSNGGSGAAPALRSGM